MPVAPSTRDQAPAAPTPVTDANGDRRLTVPDDGRCTHLGPCLPERFVLRRFLGCGSAGRVWLAHDAYRDHDVAIKVLEGSDGDLLERFRREARVAAILENPSIVKVFEIDECADVPYIVMEFVPGGNLAEARLQTTRVVRALRDVADALQHVHERGIVHRDIKPENVLLGTDGRARLTDFGLARDLSGRTGASLSREGQITGTPWCMAPEQARGDLDAIDARTDLHALGATLYFKLSGRRPFPGEGLVDVLHAVIHDAPLPLEGNTPAALQAIVMRCLLKDPGERYQSARDVVADLDGYLASAERQHEPVPWWRRAWRLAATGA